MDFAGLSKEKVRTLLNAVEYTVYKEVLNASKLRAALNEKPPSKTQTIELPEAVEGRIVPEDLFESRNHPDVRMARRLLSLSESRSTQVSDQDD